MQEPHAFLKKPCLEKPAFNSYRRSGKALTLVALLFGVGVALLLQALDLAPCARRAAGALLAAIRDPGMARARRLPRPFAAVRRFHQPSFVFSFFRTQPAADRSSRLRSSRPLAIASAGSTVDPSPDEPGDEDDASIDASSAEGDEPDYNLRWVSDLGGDDVEPRDGATTMPVFPLDMAHLLWSKPSLLIFEPRYRAMYDDILFSGARRFLVPLSDYGESDEQRLAEVGAVFYLDDLKEISQQTSDNFKYAGEHTVIGRAKVLKVLNPKAAASKETYMRAEVEVFEDTDVDADTAEAEADVETAWQALIDKQIEVDGSSSFNETAKLNSSFARGTSKDDPGLWGTIGSWQSVLNHKVKKYEEGMQKEIQKAVIDALNSGVFKDQLKSGVYQMDDFPEPLRSEIKNIQTRFQDELDGMDGGPQLFQAMLQSPSHAERLSLLKEVLDKESKRLAAVAALKAMFKT